MFESTDNRADPSTQHFSAPYGEEYWRRSAEASQAAVLRLTGRLRGRDQRIQLLERALARTVVMNHVWAVHLERRLERVSPSVAIGRIDHGAAMPEKVEKGITVRLPHMTRTLAVLFDVMWSQWSAWDPERPPKSSSVARAIDEKLGLKGQANGEASRSAQTFAAALRPDSVNEVDGRHR